MIPNKNEKDEDKDGKIRIRMTKMGIRMTTIN